MPNLRIATRRSPLALWQAEHVAAHLARIHHGVTCELLPMRTQGDKLLDAPLAKVGGKGLFVKELETALLEGRADIAVHSMKDIPVESPDGLDLSVIMARADPRDGLISGVAATLDALPEGACVGTSSLRRKCQLMALRPDLRIQNLRGGVDTRLTKLDSGAYDAILLACAGLDRLGREARIGQRIDTDIMLPAVGQGAMGIQCRADDPVTMNLIRALHDEPTAHCVAAERAMNARLEGGCQVPIAGHAVIRGSDIHLRALVASLDGTTVLRHDDRADAKDAEQLGEQVADVLLTSGAGEILRQVYADAD